MSVYKNVIDCGGSLLKNICGPKLLNTFVRPLKTAVKIKWVRPVKRPLIHPSMSGDRSKITPYDPSRIILQFENSKELETADDNVKKIFQLNLNNKFTKYALYKEELANKVRRHPLDQRSHEVIIANMTALIRFLQNYLVFKPKDVRKKVLLQHTIDNRKRQLTHLRRWDYKRFEWILEKLDLFYRPYKKLFDQVTRKKSMHLLTSIHCEELKEKKIAEYRKKMDEEKVPFLQKKFEKLQWIREQELKYDMPQSVTEEDIVLCENQLEKVKLELEEVKMKNYVRTIDPHTLEVYDAEALAKAEGKNIEG